MQPTRPASASQNTVVCFAVREEAAPFVKRASELPDVRVVITSIGAENAEKAIRGVLQPQPPALVLTCGFAGGLRPALKTGTLVYDAVAPAELHPALEQCGAVPARFTCSRRIVVTANEKRALWESTGADVVEMESGVICRLCGEASVKALTLRVVLDEAEEDLPLDFNAVLTQEFQMSYVKLARLLAAAPTKVPALVKMRQQSRLAAEGLASAILRFLEVLPGRRR